MSEHSAYVVWNRHGGDFDTSYDRTHTWEFDGGVVVPASSAPSLFGDPTRVDPEEAFVAAISSCHMMWFLFLAAEAGLIVDSYDDDALGHLERVERGIHAVTRVELRPAITWGSEAPSAERIAELHHEAHRRCFIANSVTSEITVTAR